MEPLENLYFNWLCAKVVDISSSVYMDLLKILHKTEFTWSIPMDENRASDGKELRYYFVTETEYEYPNRNDEPASVLEVLISFADRAEFQTDIPQRNWFWTFMENLRLDEYRQVSEADLPAIQDILHTFLNRTYDPRGFGGLFPMSHTQNDQRKKEIWTQFCEYILEDRKFL